MVKCKVCKNKCVKNGFQTNGKQRYYCKACKLSHQKTYTYKAYKPATNNKIYMLLINSCGICDISRVLKISRHTVKRRLTYINNQIKSPIINERHQSYEIDEMQVKVLGMGDYFYLTYAINRKTKQVINFCIGNRTAVHLSKVVNSVLLLSPKRIYTDKWRSYKKIIPNTIHGIGKPFTNRIERYHLNLRTHLKCLSRKTICYSKQLKSIETIVRIYFWGHTLNLKTL